MLKNNIDNFYKDLLDSKQFDEGFKNKLKNIRDEKEYRKFVHDEILPIAKQKGYSFNENDVVSYDRSVIQNLSEEELEKVTGGSLKSVGITSAIMLLVLGGGVAVHASKPISVTTSNTANMPATAAAVTALQGTETGPGVDAEVEESVESRAEELYDDIVRIYGLNHEDNECFEMLVKHPDLFDEVKQMANAKIDDENLESYDKKDAEYVRDLVSKVKVVKFYEKHGGINYRKKFLLEQGIIEFNYTDRLGSSDVEELLNILKDDHVFWSLNLRDAFIGDEGAKVLAEMLRTNTVLVELNLSGNYLHAEGIKNILESLMTNTTLTTLGLVHEDMGDEGAAKIAEMLLVNTTLTKLDLGNNKIGAAGAIKISESLMTNTTLMNLDLRWNKIGNEGASKISEMLLVNTTLTELCLDGNGIEDEGAKNISESLMTNTTLTTLELTSNRIKDKGAKNISESLMTNTTLTKLDLRWNE